MLNKRRQRKGFKRRRTSIFSPECFNESQNRSTQPDLTGFLRCLNRTKTRTAPCVAVPQSIPPGSESDDVSKSSSKNSLNPPKTSSFLAPIGVSKFCCTMLADPERHTEHEQFFLQQFADNPAAISHALLQSLWEVMSVKPNYFSRLNATLFAVCSSIVDFADLPTAFRLSTTSPVERQFLRASMGKIRLDNPLPPDVSSLLHPSYNITTAFDATFAKQYGMFPIPECWLGPLTRLTASDKYAPKKDASSTLLLNRERIVACKDLEQTARSEIAGDKSLTDDPTQLPTLLVQESAGHLSVLQWLRCLDDTDVEKRLSILLFRMVLAAYGVQGLVTRGRHGDFNAPNGCIGRKGLETVVVLHSSRNVVFRVPADTDTSGLKFFDLSLAFVAGEDTLSAKRSSRMYDVITFCGSLLLCLLLRSTTNSSTAVAMLDRLVHMKGSKALFTPSQAYILHCLHSRLTEAGRLSGKPWEARAVPEKILAFLAKVLRYPSPSSVRSAVSSNFTSIPLTEHPVITCADQDLVAGDIGKCKADSLVAMVTRQMIPADHVMCTAVQSAWTRPEVGRKWDQRQRETAITNVHFGSIPPGPKPAAELLQYLNSSPAELLKLPLFSRFIDSAGALGLRIAPKTSEKAHLIMIDMKT